MWEKWIIPITVRFMLLTIVSEGLVFNDKSVLMNVIFALIASITMVYDGNVMKKITQIE